MTELDGERQRLKETLARYGETLAATHDLQALVGAVLDTAVQATRSRGGRLLLYDRRPRRGHRAGADRHRPRVAHRPADGRARRARPGGRGDPWRSSRARRTRAAADADRADPAREAAAGLVTVVDPEDGPFAADDIETLSGLAVQAGVAIENARLHRQVEQQAVTDELSGTREPAPVLRRARARVRARPAVRPAAVPDHARHRRLQADQRHARARAPGRRRRDALGGGDDPGA